MAISGMTGFARVEGALGDWTWAVEARSVNGRGLDVKSKGPPGFDSLERAARDGAQGRFQRGQVNVALQARRAETASQVRINEAQLEHYIRLSERHVAAGHVSAPAFDGLLALRGVLEASEETDDADTRAAIEAAMAVTIEQALDGLKAARDGEGAALAPVLAGQVDQIAALTAKAETEAAAQTAYVKDRFEKRMADLIADTAPLEDRIVQEAAVLAAKSDVREELDRLSAHVDAARRLLAGDGGVGRRLDFLTQEFMREANTLCSKSATIPLTTIGLELKAVIEQLREQVQNVE